MDEIRRAYAILGLPHGAPPVAVRTRYRALVRQWHPDRYAGDPVAVAEATAHLRVVNDAYETLKGKHEPAPVEPPAPSAPPPQAAHGTRRLSREEIDGMIDSVNSFGGRTSKGMFAGYRGLEPTVSNALGALCAAALAVRAIVAVWQRDWTYFVRELDATIILIAVAWLALDWWLDHDTPQNRRDRRAAGDR